MEIKPLISVIVPTMGRNTLRRTIESIVNSKYPNLQILIASNNTTLFKTTNILNYPDTQLVYWSHKKVTPAKAKNEALKYAKGKYITFIDDDDTCYSGKFFVLAYYLEHYPETFACFGQYNVRDCYSNEIKNTNCGGCDRVGFDTLIQSNYIASGSIMFRNDTVVRFDESLPYGWGEDYKLSLELLGKGYKIDFIPIPVYAWTQNLKEGFTATFNKKGIDWRQLTKNIQDEARKKWRN